MPDFPAFVGPSYKSASYRADVEETINLFPEVVESHGRVTQRFLNPTPGLRTFATTSLAPIRAEFAQDGREFAVVGFGFVEVFADGTITLRGTVDNDYLPATICSGGDAALQLGIAAGGTFYSYDLVTDTLTAVAGAGTGVVTCGYLDGYFWTLDDTSTFHLSDVLNGLAWDPLQIALRNDAPDRWITGITIGKYIWLIGSETTSVLYDASTFPFPFALVPGVLINTGIGAPASVSNVNGTPFWLEQSASGGRTIVRGDGFGAPVTVSQFAMAFALQNYTTVEDAVAFSYKYQGHWFYQINFPTEDDSWALDVQSGEWFKPLFWNATTSEWECSRAQYHCVSFGGAHHVGDRQTGTIYEMSGTTYTDAGGAALRRVRRCPLPRLTDNQDWVRLRRFALIADVGIGLATGQGSDPQIMFRFSRNGGKTWGPEHWTTAGAMGEYMTRIIWERLGRYKDGMGVVEISVSDPVPFRFAGAEFITV